MPLSHPSVLLLSLPLLFGVVPRFPPLPFFSGSVNSLLMLLTVSPISFGSCCRVVGVRLLSWRKAAPIQKRKEKTRPTPIPRRNANPDPNKEALIQSLPSSPPLGWCCFLHLFWGGAAFHSRFGWCFFFLWGVFAASSSSLAYGWYCVLLLLVMGACLRPPPWGGAAVLPFFELDKISE